MSTADRANPGEEATSARTLQVLLLVPEYFGHHLEGLCEGLGLITRCTSSPSKALALLTHERCRGVIFDAQISPQEFIDELRRQALPSVALIRRVYPVFDRLFHPPLHQVVTVPFSLDELEAHMRRATMV